MLIGSLPDGTKEVVAVHDGEKESKLSWREELRDLKKRGLKQAPKLAIGDGANPIESTFATVRHRTRQTKGCGSREATLTTVWKLAMEAQRSWRRLNGYRLLEKVIAGVIFEDGEERVTEAA